MASSNNSTELSTAFIYDKYRQRLYRLMCERERSALAAAFPETGGNSQYVHNWIVCGGTSKGREPGQSERAESIIGAHHDQYRRVMSRYDREYARVQHQEHVREGRSGQYLWCGSCSEGEAPSEMYFTSGTVFDISQTQAIEMEVAA